MAATPPHAPAPDLRGDLLGGRYHLVERLAVGATATVYAAVDRHLGRHAAVKVIHPEHARTPTQRRRIIDAAAVGARVDHPHVAPLIDLGEASGAGGDPWIFLVMPLVRGPSLRARMVDGPLPWARAVDLTRQLLAGLGALHRAGAVHGDLRPGACVVDRVDGRDHLRLVDLGLARVLAGDRVAPEPAEARPLDPRPDLYAVGVILFELLTRRSPVAGASSSPRAYAPAARVPRAIEAALRRALAPAPAERFASADDFAATLAEASARASRRRRSGCPLGHAGCVAARASLAAWTRFEYPLAHAEAARAAREDPAWGPLKVVMSGLPE